MPYADKAKNDAAKRAYANSEAGRANQRAYYEANKERIKARTAEYARANRERVNATVRRRYAENTERDREARRLNARRKYRSNPIRCITGQHKTRTRELGNVSPGVTPAEWLEILEVFGHRCAYCLGATKLERDHVTPISRGGLDEYANVVPACHKCNSRKRDRGLLEWALLGGATGTWVKSRRRRVRLLGRAA